MDYVSPHFIEEIHEITIGTDPTSDMRFTVGKLYLKESPHPVTVTYIEFDQNAYVEKNVQRVLVFVKTESGEEKLWKVFQDQPLTITCKL